jgi:uncharacterized protein (TIRG00374 family)
MTKNRFNWFLLLRLAGIALFIVVLSRTNLEEMWNWLKNVDGWMVFIALVFQLMLLFFKCWRWFMLNEDEIKTGTIYQRFGEFLEAYAVGVVTPGRMGEVMKAGHAKGRTSVVNSGLLVIAERGLDLSLFFCMAGLALILGYLSVMSPAVGYLMILITIAGIFISFSILLFPGAVRLIESLMKRFHIISSDQSLNFIPKKRKTIASFILLSLFSNLSAFLSFYFLALAVMISLDFMVISGSVALAGVINTIPVTIMGLGTRDVTLLYVLSEIPKTQVLAFSGLILLISQAGGGLIALLTGQYFLFLAKKRKDT